MPAQATAERIWFEDPRGFVREDRLAMFIPWPNSTLAEKLNALMRFAVYYAAFLFLFQRTYAVLYIPLVVALVTYLVYRADATGARPRGGGGGGEDDDYGGREERYADAADGRGGGRGAAAVSASAACDKPSRDNPFMNVLVTDYSERPERPPACDLTLRAVKREAESNFEANLYRDVDDVFQRRSSSRQFYATANTTIPNDQTAFAQWLYGGARSGKQLHADAAGATTGADGDDGPLLLPSSAALPPAQ
jgi:Family of unknown function (DUF5762)